MSRRHLVLLALASGCAISSPSESEVEQSLGCPEWMCHSNSPLIDNYGFHDLNILGYQNVTGFSIGKSFDRDGTPIKISVTGGRLRGRYVSTNAEVPPVKLVGATIDIRLGSAVPYTLRVLSAIESPLWADQHTWVPTYLLQWAVRGTDRWTNVCPKPDKDMGMNAYYSVLFEGDRVDAKEKTIATRSDPNWFNIGCAGSTLAKLYLTGHSYASRAYGFDTTVPQRQTMLKMLSADYCGKGKPFTVAGVALDWKDDKGWMDYVSPTSKLEARWTPDGARCLNVPRIEASQDPAGLAAFPDLAEDIADECFANHVRLEACEEPPAGSDEFMGLHLLSANP